MPAGPDRNGAEGALPKLSFPQRLLLALPHLGRGRHGERAPLGERLRNAVLKPESPDASAAKAAKAAKAAAVPRPVDEVKADLRSADDKERLIGLLAAPFAAAIGVLVISALISNDPPAFLSGGRANKLHVSVALYHELELVLLALALVMLVTALLRKRLVLGMVMALYGLAVFNLHYWGFGVPFLLGGAWLLVRAYRVQQELKAATAGGPRGAPPRGNTSARARANKRYTPPK
jgi:hypothetical protein